MPNSSVLIIDDEPDIRELLAITLTKMGLDVVAAESITEAKALFTSQSFDLCLSDLRLPDGSGIEFVDFVQSINSETPVIVITAHGSTDSAVSAMKAGAFDFISKPVDLAHLRNLINQALSSSDTTHEQQDDPIAHIIGQSAIVQQMKQRITKVARSQAPVYISGESGSGKELVARAIHQLSPRSEAAFVAINCGAIPSELMESEFFGHKKGSFTGAHQDKSGFFEQANGGTLFLDEVADLPLAMQVKLLRTLQEKTIRAIGADTEQRIDVRIICATHKNLQLEVENKNFRSDLFYRINVINIPVAPLRDRAEDIPLLIDYIIDRINSEQGSNLSLTESAIADISHYHFPGNIRELENVLERATALCEGESIHHYDLALTPSSSVNHLPKETTGTNTTPEIKYDYEQTLDDYLNQIEKRVLLSALEKNRWNRTTTAKDLGITFRSLRYRLKKLDLDE